MKSIFWLDEVMNMGNSRDDFTSATKELLANRVGRRCSNPACRKLTCGANTNPEKITNIGVAAHICAAASTAREKPAANWRSSSPTRSSRAGNINDPSVNVQFADMKISVVGEVARPGQYDVTRDKISIFDALAMAGDLTIYGIRTDVAVPAKWTAYARSNTSTSHRKTSSTRRRLHPAERRESMSSPNKYKAQAGEISQNRNFYLSLVSTAISGSNAYCNSY